MQLGLPDDGTAAGRQRPSARAYDLIARRLRRRASTARWSWSSTPRRRRRPPQAGVADASPTRRRGTPATMSPVDRSPPATFEQQPRPTRAIDHRRPDERSLGRRPPRTWSHDHPRRVADLPRADRRDRALVTGADRGRHRHLRRSSATPSPPYLALVVGLAFLLLIAGLPLGPGPAQGRARLPARRVGRARRGRRGLPVGLAEPTSRRRADRRRSCSICRSS